MNVIDFFDTFYCYAVLVEDSLARVAIAQGDQMIVDDEVCLPRLKLNLRIDPKHEMFDSVLEVIRKIIAPESEMVSVLEQALFECKHVSIGVSVSFFGVPAPSKFDFNCLPTVCHAESPERHRMA
jgi:hypothetical protein